MAKKKKPKLLLNPHRYGNPLPKFLPPKNQKGMWTEGQVKGRIFDGFSQFGFVKVLWWCIWAYFLEYLPKRKYYEEPREEWLKFLERIHGKS